ncbi:lipoprotein [Micromonospora sp. WMMD882]|uniref:lipoprotein n=1 Tax=Micromonospora sp. WMMD882 TaxID=3015151 RepID=UPI00248C8BA5|nr:lipoprotein [Micromonospora sp. WMMD882]WBB79619.1 lipoprotein [Micromonospora sp. WMMD882]
MLTVPALALAACGRTDPPTPSAAPAASAGSPAPHAPAGSPAPHAPAGSPAPLASPVARVGGVGSACELPVTFGLAASWQPEAVAPMAPDDPWAALARRGPLTMACEIDAKPAGAIGFLRVWTGGEAEPRASLRAFIGTQAQDPAYTELRVDGRPAVEVTYRTSSQLDDALKPERAFAVRTGRGVVAVSLDSPDHEEHEEMLPAYELARRTLVVTR